jgi:hypothetical protein
MKLELTDDEARALMQALDAAVRAHGLELAARILPVAVRLDELIRTKDD